MTETGGEHSIINDPAGSNDSRMLPEPTVVKILNRSSRIIPDIWVPLGMCSILVSGIPAYLLMGFYKVLQIAGLLGLTQVSDKHLFTLFYILCLGSSLPFLAFIATLVCLGIVFSRVPLIRVDREGITLPSAVAPTCVRTDMKKWSPCCGDVLGYADSLRGAKKLSLKFLQTRMIPWDAITTIEYRFSGDSFRVPRIQIDTCCAPGRNHSYNIDLLSLCQPDRKALANALCCFAPDKARRRPDAIKPLQPGSYPVSYTDLWLDHGGDRNAHRVKLLFPGETIKDGRYRVLESLASGGQSNIYLAEDLANQGESPVILKEFILPVDHSRVDETSQPYTIERRILQNLSHPGIVRLLDSFEEVGRACLILARVHGISLAALIEEKGCLNTQEALKLALSMAGILKYLHRLSPRIVHRDFSPRNIILARDALAAGSELELTVIDFASALQTEQRGQTIEEAVGTLAFTAPEQFRGRATCQSDIYSFGATLYFALTGNEPEPLRRLSPRQYNKSVAVGLDSIVSRATEQETKDRYRDVDELLADLLTIDH
jgi:hypothetical protein